MRITIIRKARPKRDLPRRINIRRLRARAMGLLAMLKLPPVSELNVVLDTDESLRDLHHRYFGLDTRTNVISFGQWEGGAAGIRRQWRRLAAFQCLPLGDVVISVDRAFAEAKNAGVSPEVRVTQLLVHGVLHILGYEHERGGRKARAMQEAEERLLRRLLGNDPNRKTS